MLCLKTLSAWLWPALYTLVPTFFSILFLMTSSGRNIPGWLAAVDSDAVGVVAGLEVVGGAFGP